MKKEMNDLEVLKKAIIPEAVGWVEQLKAYRLHKGKDLEYFRRARLGVSIVSAAVRLCATFENARSNDIIQERMVLLELPPAGRQLKG